ncbi:MAG: YdiU family protein [Pseudomonadota bacterium]
MSKQRVPADSWSVHRVILSDLQPFEQSPVFAEFDNTYRQLPEGFFALRSPRAPEAPELMIFNKDLATELGLDVSQLDSDQLADMLSGKRLPDDAEPLAMAYAGHQFGHFVPQLGDGRALLLGEVVTPAGERRDIQLKGAGPTPFSRGGDGLAAMGPVLREYLVSEAMARLGVPTTRALAAVATGEPVYRERGAELGAVLTRVAASHVRVGTFQYFAARGDRAALSTLLDYVVRRHDPELAETDESNKAQGLIKAVIQRQSALVAQWMRLGFVHGVMNTDNCAISGETIDYGPCAFIDRFDPRTVFSSIDHQGRYAYANQPGIAQWNIARLAETLLPLLDTNEEKALSTANELITGYTEVWHAAYRRAMGQKFGISEATPDDDKLIEDFLSLLSDGNLDFTATFRQLAELTVETTEDALPETIATRDAGRWKLWLSRWRQRLADNDGAALNQASERMNQVNPAIIPRNHEVELALTAAASEGNLKPFLKLHKALQNPFESTPDNLWLQKLPDAGLPSYRTFCGT